MCTTESRVRETRPFEALSPRHHLQYRRAHRHAGAALESPRGRPARILVVDDNVDLARGLARLLQIHGHDVRVAYDGPTGLDEAKNSKPDVVLLDIGLPGMDGYQLAAHLRRDETVKNCHLDRNLRLRPGGRPPARQGSRLRSSPGQTDRLG